MEVACYECQRNGVINLRGTKGNRAMLLKEEVVVPGYQPKNNDDN